VRPCRGRARAAGRAGSATAERTGLVSASWGAAHEAPVSPEPRAADILLTRMSQGAMSQCTQETRIQNALFDVASSTCLCPPRT